jgi:hypothetical protein
MSTSRRDFIQTAALAVAGAAFGTVTRASDSISGKCTPSRPRPLKFSADMRDGLMPRRVTNAMWDYSHPYWKNWSDVAWYRKVNQRFLKS